MSNFAYETVSRAWATKFLSTHSDLLTLATRPSNSYGTRLVIGEFSVHNRSGSTAIVGVGGRLQADIWRAYFWDESEYAAGSVLIDETTDAQDTDTGDVNLATVGTSNDGFAFGCDVPFNLASILVSQTSNDGAAWEVYYSVASTGTGFSSNFQQIANANLYVAPSFTSTGEQVIWFEPPVDWHPVDSSTAIVNRHGRSDRQVLGYTAPRQYLLVLKAATAPDTNRGQMTSAVLGRMMMTTEGVADADILTNIGGAEIFLPPQCDALAAAISVSNAQNRVDMKWRYSG